jgi:hypothetical protein
MWQQGCREKKPRSAASKVAALHGVTTRAARVSNCQVCDDRQSRVRAGLSLLLVLPAARLGGTARGWRPPGAPWSCSAATPTAPLAYSLVSTSGPKHPRRRLRRRVPPPVTVIPTRAGGGQVMPRARRSLGVLAVCLLLGAAPPAISPRESLPRRVREPPQHKRRCDPARRPRPRPRRFTSSGHRHLASRGGRHSKVPPPRGVN